MSHDHPYSDGYSCYADTPAQTLIQYMYHMCNPIKPTYNVCTSAWNQNPETDSEAVNLNPESEIQHPEANTVHKLTLSSMSQTPALEAKASA